VGSTGATSIAPGGTTFLELTAGVDEGDLVGSTLVRIRGEMVVWQSGTVTPTDVQTAEWDAGILVGHENLVTTPPDPGLDDAGWLWHATGFLVPAMRSNDAKSDQLIDAFPARYIIIDNKSKRKFPTPESTMLFVFKNDAGSDLTVQVGVTIRFLLMLH